MTNQRRKGLISINGQPPDQLVDALKSHLPLAEWQLLQAILKMSLLEKIPLYIVGGMVRDLLLGDPSFDFDLVLEGNAIEFANKIAEHFGGKITSHARFGTALWTLGQDRIKIASKLGIEAEGLPAIVDFISARHEIYATPGALPDVTFGDIKADTGRRDFSINTLALRLDGAHLGELIDCWHGLEDLEKRSLRILHDRSFEDDPTRILRLFRFKHRLGFQIESQSELLIKKSLPQLADISGERIRNELDKMLAEKSWADALAEMESSAVLKAIHAGFSIDQKSLAALKFLNAFNVNSAWGLDELPKAWLAMTVWFMQFDKDLGQAISERFNLEKDIREALAQLDDWAAALAKLENMSVSKVTFWLDTLSPLARLALFVRGQGLQGVERVKSYVEIWQAIRPKTNGRDLKSMGLKEGPQYAEILASLRAAWLDDEISSDEEEKILLTELIKSKKR